MLLEYIHTLAAPGKLRSQRTFIGSVLAMIVIFALDILTPVDIRLHVLYIFPLALLAIHTEQASSVAAALFFSVALQLATFYLDAVPVGPFITDAAQAIVSSLLVIMLGRISRKNYLDVLRLASRDPLTGLLNRRSFESATDIEIAKQKRYGNVFSVAMIDLDNFKSLNDSEGHLAGDKALKLVANVLLEHTRHADIVARLGGDEFAILIPNTREAESGLMCRNLTAMIAEKMREVGFPITASIGCATFQQAPESIAYVLQLADKAMYAAKAERRTTAPDSKISSRITDRFARRT